MLTLGPVEAEEQVRYAVSVGMHRGVVLPITDDEWDPQRTARAITAAVRDLEAADGPFDLILFGNESADSGGFQVGIRVAYALGRPMVNGAKGLTVEGDIARVEREADAGREAYDLPLPAVVGHQGGHQPSPLPDDEGPARVEEGRDRHDRTGRRAAGGLAQDHAAATARTDVADRHPRSWPRRRSGRRRRARRDRSPVMGGVLVVVEHDRGDLAPASLEALTAARALAAQLGATVEALTIGEAADGLAEPSWATTAPRRCTRCTTTC